MPRQNVLSDGASVAKFKTIELHQELQMVTDSRGPRTVVHEFPYRDIGKIEVLGRRPHKTEWQLTFTGDGWRTRFLALSDSIDADPSGLLVHPIYGQMQVVTSGIDRAVLDIVNAVDTISFSLSFTEDEATLGTQQQQSASTRKQNVSSANEELLSKAAAYVSAAIAVQALAAASEQFAQAAFDSAASTISDPSLPGLLDNVGTTTEAAQLAILADPLGNDALTYDALAQSEVVFAACLDLADEVALETGSFELFVAAGLTSIGVICGDKYGPRAISMIDKVLQLNPKLLDPSAIPAGTPIVLPL